MAVFALPPSDGWRILVNFESRYGMCFLSPPSDSFAMTLPRANRDLLIWPPSFSLIPSAPVWPTRSDPARSTKLRHETLTAPEKEARDDVGEDKSRLSITYKREGEEYWENRRSRRQSYIHSPFWRLYGIDSSVHSYSSLQHACFLRGWLKKREDTIRA